MASIKALCTRGVLLEQGQVKFMGNIKDTVDYYIGEGGSSENQYFDDLATAPGNDVIRIKSFEILPGKPQANIDIESGIKFKLQFMCYKKDAMLDVDMLVRTMDDINVVQVCGFLGEIGNKDSKKGLYEVEFVIPPYTLNAGRYKAEIWFGENQRYVVYGGFEQNFQVDNTLSDMGFNQNVLPGMLRLKNNFEVKYLG
jgi:lipopolysaccharide transport system ATP-binding protein